MEFYITYTQTKIQTISTFCTVFFIVLPGDSSVFRAYLRRFELVARFWVESVPSRLKLDWYGVLLSLDWIHAPWWHSSVVGLKRALQFLKALWFLKDFETSSYSHRLFSLSQGSPRGHPFSQNTTTFQFFTSSVPDQLWNVTEAELIFNSSNTMSLMFAVKPSATKCNLVVIHEFTSLKLKLSPLKIDKYRMLEDLIVKGNLGNNVLKDSLKKLPYAPKRLLAVQTAAVSIVF